MKNGDSLTSRDLVIRQYESLPYPGIPEEKLLRIEKYSKGDCEQLRNIHPTGTLEKMNHYLHQGSENFE